MKPTQSKSSNKKNDAPAVQANSPAWYNSKLVLSLISVFAVLLTYLIWNNFFRVEQTQAANNLPTQQAVKTAQVTTTSISTLPIAIADREELRKKLVSQLEEVDHTLCSYREASKYPLSSRPIDEHPDQIYPNQAITEQHPMRKRDGKTDATIQISSSQSRVYLAANESVSFSVQAKDANQQSLPIFVTRAFSTGLNFNSDRPSSQLPLAFADNGRDGDAQANDGIASALLHPANTSLAGFHGTIRTEIEYTVNGCSITF